jgi:hypothetical protein
MTDQNTRLPHNAANSAAIEYVMAGLTICLVILGIANQGAVGAFLMRWAAWF